MSRTYRRCTNKQGKPKPLPKEAFWEPLQEREKTRKSFLADDKWNRRFYLTDIPKKRKNTASRQCMQRLKTIEDFENAAFPSDVNEWYFGDAIF